MGVLCACDLYTMFRGQRKVLQSLDLELVRIESRQVAAVY